MIQLVKSFVLILCCLLASLDFNVYAASDDLSTIEPEASTGCAAPDLRFATPRKEGTTTESPYAEFETTQIYLPEDFTTADIEFVENVDIDISSSTLDEIGDDKKHNKYAELNPYRVETEVADVGETDHDSEGLLRGHDVALAQNANARRRGKKRRFTPGKRRRVETEHGGGGRDRHGRYERHAVSKREIQSHDKKEKHRHLIPPPLGKVYYIESVDLLSAAILNKTKMSRGHKHKNKTRSSVSSSNKSNLTENELPPHGMDTQQNVQQEDEQDKHQHEYNNSNRSNDNNEEIKNSEQVNSPTSTSLSEGLSSFTNASRKQQPVGDDVKQTETFDLLGQHDVNENNNTNWNQSETDQNSEGGLLQRVKRKSGKTTGALSRPKGGGDSGTKTTSRKGDKGGYDEEGGNVPFHPDEEESSEEESEESDEISHFSHVSEIRFPGEVGPLGDRRLCKIRCVKGKWVGPLCATNEEDDHGNIKFQPLYKSCHVNRVPPHLLLSYRNISVNVGWDLPHGHSLQARCKDLGLYKLLGESRVLCSNGLWAPRMPSCVPTTLLTNYSDDSPPSIRIKIGAGSGAFEPSGVLAVLPGSTIHLDCMYPRRRGTPEWTWTGWFNQANPVGWSTIPEEKATKYRLTIKDIQNQDSGTYTCASPRGLTNSIVIVVATSQCPQLPDPASPLSLRLEGNKLGQRALYRCPLGYTIDGTANSTCLASGNWSSPPPVCHPVQCPPLFLEDPHLSLTELNTSAWGRAVFKCSWGFRLSGPPGLECEPSGAWSGPVPRCRAIQCPTPLVPINGRIDGTSGSSSHRRYAVGALVTFSCTEGHLLVGEASIVCTETGFWSHPPPFCKSQCPYPGDPPNGLIAPLKFHYDPGDLLSVQCRPGFVEYGANGPPERPRCLPDGNWSGPVPQCRSYEEV